MKQDYWRLIRDGQKPGLDNMATDRALLSACEDESVPPTLRLYGWNKPTLSLGYSQNAERDVDLARAKALGVDVVRRPTGGRALLHHREVTYSIVAPLGTVGLGVHLKDIFSSIGDMLIFGLGSLGIPPGTLRFEEGQGRGRAGHRSSACFAALHFGEITANGKKLIGSAQRRTQHAFLQHGSILLDEDFDLFTRMCRYQTEEGRLLELERLRNGSTTLSELTETPVTFDTVIKALSRGFQIKLNGNLEPGGLSPRECELRDAFLGGS